MREMLEAGGGIALRHFHRVDPKRKNDATYVTQADLEVQGYLQAELEKRFPGDGIIAEEQSLRRPPRGGHRYWAVDPIDGTAAFVSGLPVWGISVGLVDLAGPLAGFFFMPKTKDFFYSITGESAYRNGDRIQVKQPRSLNSETVLLAVSRFHRDYRIVADFGGKVRSLGSTAAHLCYVAAGGVDAVLVGRVRVWDIAAGLAVLRGAGGELRYLKSGKPVDLFELFPGERARQPMVGGHPSTIARFRRIISRAEN